MTTVVQMLNVSKTFRGRELYSNVNMEIEAGKIHALQGPNGSGKSVLFKLMCGFIRPDAGTVEIAPEFMDARRMFPESFGVIIDRPGYIGGLTGRENLMRLAEIRGQIGRAEVEEAMKRVGLEPDLKQKVRQYSLGMKQKLALAQSFMEGQQVLVLDEPFNALDVDSVENVRGLLKSFRDEGRTIVFTSHNSEDVDLLADRVFRINAGTVEELDRQKQD